MAPLVSTSMDDGSSWGSGGGSPRGAWHLRGVSWRRVFGQQDFGSVASTIITLVGVFIAWQVSQNNGVEMRPFEVTDPTLSYPSVPTTIPYWSVVVASILALLLTVIVAELMLGHNVYADLTDALAAALHFGIDGISAFLVTAVVTQLTKYIVGRYRPDWLDRCQPAIPDPVTFQYGQTAAANPPCTAPDSSNLTDGRYSFPSGHTSTAFVLSVWTIGYTIWAFNCRPPRKTAIEVRRMGWGARLMRELGTCAAFLWIVALLVYAWFVGVSRITDYKHHASDVGAGAMLGTLFGTMFVLRAIGRLPGVVADPTVLLGGASYAKDVNGGPARPPAALLSSQYPNSQYQNSPRVHAEHIGGVNV